GGCPSRCGRERRVGHPDGPCRSSVRRPAGHTIEDIITRSPAMRTGNSALTRAHRLAGWWSLAGLATAAVLLLALVGVTFWVSRPQAVSAEEILDKAQAAAAGADASGVRGEVALTLVNSYDGVDHVRYSCDIVRR